MSVKQIKLTYKLTQEGKKWLASCVELGTSVFGKSEKDAMNKLEEAVECHLATLESLGEADRFFKENGIVPEIVSLADPAAKLSSAKRTIIIEEQRIVAECA